MNKLMIPSILVAIVMVAGVFAFYPIDQASTVHNTTGLIQILFSTQLTLEDDTAEFITFSATSDSLVIGIFADPSATVGTEKDFFVCQIQSGDHIIKRGITEANSGDDDGIFCESVADGGPEGSQFNNNDKDQAFDLINNLANFSSGQRFVIPVDAGDDFVLGFMSENGDTNTVTLDVTLTIIGAGTFSVTSIT